MEMNNDQEFVIARLEEKVFDITEQNIWATIQYVKQVDCLTPEARTNFLRSHRLVADTVLMNFDFTRQSLTIKSRSNESVTHFDWSAPFHFNETGLFNNIRHFFLLLLPFIGFLLQIVDLFN